MSGDGALDGLGGAGADRVGQALPARAARAAQPLRAPPRRRAAPRRRQEARADPRRRPGIASTASAAAAQPAQRDGSDEAVGWEFVHVCVDDATRLAYVEVLADEKATTAVGFLRRAIAFYAAHGITVERVMTDNGACLPLHHPRLRLPRARPPPPAHPALPAAHQRQGRALHPHPARRLGLRRDLRLKPTNAPQPLTAGYGPTTIAAHTAPSATSRPIARLNELNNVPGSYS